MVLLFKIGKEYLLDGVGTVKNGVPDIVIKQRNGHIPQRNIFHNIRFYNAPQLP